MDFTKTFIEYRKVREKFNAAFKDYGLVLANKPQRLNSLDSKVLLVQRLIDFQLEVERRKLKNTEFQQEIATIGSNLFKLFKLGEVAPFEEIEIEISPKTFVRVWYTDENFIVYSDPVSGP